MTIHYCKPKCPTHVKSVPVKHCAPKAPACKISLWSCKPKADHCPPKYVKLLPDGHLT